MAQIDFYISDKAQPNTRELLSCRLIEKAWAQGIPAYIHTANVQQAQQLDELLWRFKDDSFIPHSRLPIRPEQQAPILIGHGPHIQDPQLPDALLINLSDTIPDNYQRFKRILEIIDADPDRRQAGRRRYQSYKNNGDRLSNTQL